MAGLFKGNPLGRIECVAQPNTHGTTNSCTHTTSERIQWTVYGACDVFGFPLLMIVMGLLPLFDPPRHDSAETIRQALNLGVNVKMITGDQLAIGKETRRRLGTWTNMYPSSALLGDAKSADVGGTPIDELIEKADGFAVVFPDVSVMEIMTRLLI